MHVAPGTQSHGVDEHYPFENNHIHYSLATQPEQEKVLAGMPLCCGVLLCGYLAGSGCPSVTRRSHPLSWRAPPLHTRKHHRQNVSSVQSLLQCVGSTCTLPSVQTIGVLMSLCCVCHSTLLCTRRNKQRYRCFLRN